MTFEQEAMREYARNVGREHPEREWIATPLDSWERNPFFAGTPGRHPEEHPEDDEFRDAAKGAADAVSASPIRAEPAPTRSEAAPADDWDDIWDECPF